jgi:hypothetical protein
LLRPLPIEQTPHRETDQAGCSRVQKDIRQMVTHHRVAPQPMLHPERGVQQRIILLGRTHLAPDAFQACGRLHIRLGNVKIVVPEESATNGWQVRQQRHGEYQGRRPEAPKISRQQVHLCDAFARHFFIARFIAVVRSDRRLTDDCLLTVKTNQHIDQHIV